jgi:protein-S-isoprenylcysteine O-methyltransferase Ste14
LRLLSAVLVLPALLVLPAGTLAYWQAWVYLAVLLVPTTATAAYLLWRDPELLERRLQAREKDAAQGRIVALAGLIFILVILIPAFDRRFGWSAVPVPAVLLADLLVFAGYGLFVLVLRENRSASRIIEVQEGQRVVTTGPYSIVRHPMYVAVLAMGLGTPVALGSWWAIIPALLLMPVLVARIRNEERLLTLGLAGYREYVKMTRYRLVPGIW